jgi:hypothetical protein
MEQNCPYPAMPDNPIAASLVRYGILELCRSESSMGQPGPRFRGEGGAVG